MIFFYFFLFKFFFRGYIYILSDKSSIYVYVLLNKKIKNKKNEIFKYKYVHKVIHKYAKVAY